MREPYPESPGSNWRDTSRDAADQIREPAGTLRSLVYDLICSRPNLTTHECAELLGRPVSSVQPRFSELAATGRIVDSGQRRRNLASGKNAIAWEVPRGQLELFADSATHKN